MIIFFTMAVYGTACLISAIRPKEGAMLYWPLSLCYPSYLLQGKLPLNAGFDDVLLLFLIVGVFISGSGRPKVLWPILAALFFTSITIVGDLSSIALNSDMNIVSMWKRELKMLGLIGYMFVICSSMATWKDIKFLVISIVFGALISGTFVVIYSLKPGLYNPFQGPYLVSIAEKSGYQAIGPFMAHDIAGGILSFATLLSYNMACIQSTMIRKSLLMIITFCLFVALLVCGSRTGWAFAFVSLVILFIQNKRIGGLFTILLLTICLLIAQTQFEYFSERLSKTFHALMSGDIDLFTSGRVSIWKEQLSKPKMIWLLCGEGFGVQTIYHPHSNYVSIIKNLGLFGCVFWVYFYTNLLRKCKRISSGIENFQVSQFFKDAFVIYIGYFVFFITSTPVMWSSVFYIDFTLMAAISLIDKEIALSNKKKIFKYI